MSEKMPNLQEQNKERDEGEKFIKDYPELKDAYLEGRIKLFDMVIGERIMDQIQKELKEREDIEDCNNPKEIRNDASWMLLNKNFKIDKKTKNLKLVKLSVADLGFPRGAEFQEIIAKGKELGLELCPPEVGPLLRLDYQKLMGYDQPKGEYIAVAMDPVCDSYDDSRPRVFNVNRNHNSMRCLDYSLAVPGSHFATGSGFNTGSDFLFVRK